MPTTANGEVSLYYETFGADDDPVLLLVNGLGSQCINFKTEFCEMFADRGFRVVRFDNRDVGLSSHLKGGPRYTVDDMARDGFAVLDAIGADVAHIAGWSMGGMIVQAMALLRPGRVLSMTSVMSAPGPIAGERDPDVTAAFSAPAGRYPGRGRRPPPGRPEGVGQPRLLRRRAHHGGLPRRLRPVLGP